MAKRCAREIMALTIILLLAHVSYVYSGTKVSGLSKKEVALVVCWVSIHTKREKKKLKGSDRARLNSVQAEQMKLAN